MADAIELARLLIFVAVLALSLVVAFRAYELMKLRRSLAERGYGGRLNPGRLFTAKATLSMAIALIGTEMIVRDALPAVAEVAESMGVVLLTASMTFFLIVTLDVGRREGG